MRPCDAIVSPASQVYGYETGQAAGKSRAGHMFTRRKGKGMLAPACVAGMGGGSLTEGIWASMYIHCTSYIHTQTDVGCEGCLDVRDVRDVV